MAGMKWSRGEIYLLAPAPKGDPRKRRAVVIVSRQTLCDSNADKLVCAPVNGQAYGRSTEVAVGTEEGLKHDSVINCDQLVLVPKAALSNYVGRVSPRKRPALNAALRIALDT